MAMNNDAFCYMDGYPAVDTSSRNILCLPFLYPDVANFTEINTDFGEAYPTHYYFSAIYMQSDKLFYKVINHDDEDGKEKIYGVRLVVDPVTKKTVESERTLVYEYTPPSSTDSNDYISGIAVDITLSNLYLIHHSYIDVCPLTSWGTCRAPTLVAGSRSNAGYYRDTTLNSYFDNIQKMIFFPNRIYIQDSYGVAVVPLTIDTGDQVEQYIGHGVDKVFHNSISRKAISNRDEFYLSGMSFATNDIQSIVGGRFLVFNDHRGSSVSDTFLFDDNFALHDTFYCGAEDVSMDLRDIIRMFEGHPYNVSLQDVLDDDYLGLSRREQTQLKQINWISLSTDCDERAIHGKVEEPIEASRSFAPPSTKPQPAQNKKQIRHVQDVIGVDTPQDVQEATSDKERKPVKPDFVDVKK